MSHDLNAVFFFVVPLVSLAILQNGRRPVDPRLCAQKMRTQNWDIWIQEHFSLILKHDLLPGLISCLAQKFHLREIPYTVVTCHC